MCTSKIDQKIPESSMLQCYNSFSDIIVISEQCISSNCVLYLQVAGSGTVPLNITIHLVSAKCIHIIFSINKQINILRNYTKM